MWIHEESGSYQTFPEPAGGGWRLANADEIAQIEAGNWHTAAEIVEAFRSAIQVHLDAAAQALGYDNIASAVTYAEEPAVPKFQAEGRAFRAWRSAVWDYSYEQLALVEAGQRPAPTIPDFIAELPPLDLPAPPTAGQE